MFTPREQVLKKANLNLKLIFLIVFEELTNLCFSHSKSK